MKKYSSYFLLTHQSHLLLLLCVYPFSILAKPHYVFQSENPIANFVKNGLLPCVIQKKAVIL